MNIKAFNGTRNMQARKARRSSGRAKGRFPSLATACLLAFSMILMGGFHAHGPHAEAGIHMSAMQDGQVPTCDKAGMNTQTDEACCIAAAGCGLFAAKETGAFSASLLESERNIAPTTYLHSAMLFMDYPPPKPVLSRARALLLALFKDEPAGRKPGQAQRA